MGVRAGGARERAVDVALGFLATGMSTCRITFGCRERSNAALRLGCVSLAAVEEPSRRGRFGHFGSSVTHTVHSSSARSSAAFLFLFSFFILSSSSNHHRPGLLNKKSATALHATHAAFSDGRHHVRMQRSLGVVLYVHRRHLDEARYHRAACVGLTAVGGFSSMDHVTRNDFR